MMKLTIWEKLVGFLMVIAMIAMGPILIFIAIIKSIYEIFMYGFKAFVEKGKDTEE